jgi:ABC-type lipoprotein export system ATPase subunit
MDILIRLWKEGRTIVMVTHNDRISARSERIVRLFDGQVIKGTQ